MVRQTPMRLYASTVIVAQKSYAWGPIFVLHAILDFIVDNYMPITDRLGRYLREQERYVFTYEFDKGTLKNLYQLKSQLVHMRAIILPVQDICSFF
ncbi:magnesium and cobalt transport protein CorA, partial [marine sediment metagenome]